MNITTQIDTVGRFPDRPWTNQEGKNVWFIDGTFKDGRKFSKGAMEETKAKELHDTLTRLIGQEGTFEVEETNREYKGQREYRLKAYPGQPQFRGGFGGGGGGRPAGGGYPARYRDTEQGVREERDSIVRQTALKAAVEFLVNQTGADDKAVIGYCNSFYGWLTSGKPILPEKVGSISGEPSAYDKYMGEIAAAVKAQNAPRLEQIKAMIHGSLDKGTINLDQASNLNDELSIASKALASSAGHNEWVKQKQAEAWKSQPRHEDSRMNQTMIQAEDVF